MNAKVASYNNTSHLSPLRFVNHAVHNLQTPSDVPHKVRDNCVDVEAVLGKEFEVKLGCT